MHAWSERFFRQISLRFGVFLDWGHSHKFINETVTIAVNRQEFAVTIIEGWPKAPTLRWKVTSLPEMIFGLEDGKYSAGGDDRIEGVEAIMEGGGVRIEDFAAERRRRRARGRGVGTNRIPAAQKKKISKRERKRQERKIFSDFSKGLQSPPLDNQVVHKVPRRSKRTSKRVSRRNRSESEEVLKLGKDLGLQLEASVINAKCELQSLMEDTGLSKKGARMTQADHLNEDA